MVADLLLSAGKVINKIGMGGPNPGIARNGGGNSAPCQDVFGGFVHNALRALQSAHLSPKSDNLPPKCALLPQNRSFNHISKFSLTKMIYALLSKNVVSRIYALLLAKFAKVPG